MFNSGEISHIQNLLLQVYNELNIKEKLVEQNLEIFNIESTRKNNQDITIIDLINNISIYVNSLLEIKGAIEQEEKEEKLLYKQYEELLIQAENDIRRHIKVSKFFLKVTYLFI